MRWIMSHFLYQVPFQEFQIIVLLQHAGLDQLVILRHTKAAEKLSHVTVLDDVFLGRIITCRQQNRNADLRRIRQLQVSSKDGKLFSPA